MLIGNQQAPEVKHINWYIGESVQTTGVAIETRGFTFVTSGRKRDTLKETPPSPSTTSRVVKFKASRRLHRDIHLQGQELLVRRPRRLPGTGGRRDGVPFRRHRIHRLPRGPRRLDPLLLRPDRPSCASASTWGCRLSEHHAELAYYMGKADQVEKEHDRQRVLIQITQNLAGRIKNSHAFKLPTIYLSVRPRRPSERPRGGVRRHRQGHPRPCRRT